MSDQVSAQVSEEKRSRMAEGNAMPRRDLPVIDKLETGISGLDRLMHGGLPRHRVTLLAGTSGSAKTVLSAQFLVEGVARGEPGVFVTMEEPPEAIRENMAGMGWDIPAMEAAGDFAFVDASPDLEGDVVLGEFDFGGLIARIGAAIERIGATRVVLDSIGSVFVRFGEPALVRRELGVVSAALREREVTSIVTVERLTEDGPISRHDVEEFVADNVIILRNRLGGERRRRTIEVLKVRGSSHSKGEYPFSVLSETAVQIVPINNTRLDHRSTLTRITSGVEDLDEMLGGGLFRDAITVVSGATGTGKTLLTTHFLAAGAQADERCLLLAFEESPEQLARNATSWGFDYDDLQGSDTLRVLSVFPESQSLEDHLVMIREQVLDYKPTRIAIDSMSALERVSEDLQFREFCIGLISFLKQEQIATFLTSTTSGLSGGPSVTDAHVSTLTDTILLLRYVEADGRVERALHVLKMRGSRHDTHVRRYQITDDGMKIDEPFDSAVGIIRTPAVSQSE